VDRAFLMAVGVVLVVLEAGLVAVFMHPNTGGTAARVARALEGGDGVYKVYVPGRLVLRDRMVIVYTGGGVDAAETRLRLKSGQCSGVCTIVVSRGEAWIAYKPRP